MALECNIERDIKRHINNSEVLLGATTHRPDAPNKLKLIQFLKMDVIYALEKI